MADYFVTEEGINIPTRTADPVSPAEGTLWHRSDTNDIRFHVNSTVTIIPLVIGDMAIATFDPTGVNGDAFAMDSMVEGVNTKVLTAAERTKLTGIETDAKDDQDADEVPYDNTSSGLTAVDVQTAIDEVLASVTGLTLVAEASSEAESTNGTTGFVQKLKLTDTFTADDHIIYWSFETTIDSTGKSVDAQIQLDDSVDLANDTADISNVANAYQQKSGFIKTTLTAASHDIDIDFRVNPSTSGATSKIRRARIVVYKV